MTNKKQQPNTIQLVEKHIIKPKHELWSYVDTLCWQSRCLRNKANFIIRQNFFSKKNHKFLNYNTVDKLFKKHKNLEEVYRLIPHATIAQQCLRQLNNEWQSFFKATKSYNKDASKFLGRPKPPKYKKDKQTYIAILLPQEFKVFKHYVQLPKFLNNYKIPYKNNGKLTQIRVVPCSNNVYKIELIFDCVVTDNLPNNDKYLSIDLGINNFATITTNIGTKPILLNGKDLKSINQYYNKKISHCKSLLPFYSNGKQHSTSKQIERLYTNRNNKILANIHRKSKFIVDYANTLNITTIIIGYNKGWKQESDMGKQNNQNFVQIPFLTFIEQIQYKAKLKGITVILQEESYTSGTSFFDKEYPNKQNYNKKRRIYRGLFKTNSNILINADVNSSYQIMKKYLQISKKDYVVEGLQDLIFINQSYALSPNKVTINNNIAINKLY